MTSSSGNNFRVAGPLCGEFTGHRWIPLTNGSDAELWFFFDLRLNKQLSKQPWRRWLETLSRSLWRRCNAVFGNASLDTHSYKSLVIQLLAAIISLLIITLIVVSQVALVFSGGSRLMEFNNRCSPPPKLNVFMTFVRCRYTKIWNWFEYIRYIPSRLILPIGNCIYFFVTVFLIGLCVQ